MGKLIPTWRLHPALFFGLIGAALGAFQAGPFFDLHTLWSSLAGFAIGFLWGLLAFQKPKRKEAGKIVKEYPPLHVKLPPELRDSYYTDHFMKRVMEVYQPHQARDQTDDQAEERARWENTFGFTPVDTGEPSTADREDSRIDFWQAIGYPTQLPTTLAVVWLVIFTVVGWIFFPNFSIPTQIRPRILSFILVPSFLLIGLSGIMVLSKRTTTNVFGRMIYGSGAYPDGLVKISLGLLGCIYFLYLA